MLGHLRNNVSLSVNFKLKIKCLERGKKIRIFIWSSKKGVGPFRRNKNAKKN